MNEYRQGAEFLLTFGLPLSIAIIFTVLILAFGVGFLAWKCVQDLYNRDEENFRYKNLWMILFSISIFSIFFWGFGLFFTLILSVIYIVLYKPKLS